MLKRIFIISSFPFCEICEIRGKNIRVICVIRVPVPAASRSIGVICVIRGPHNFFGKMTFGYNICKAMKQNFNTIQWWWHTNSSGVM